MNTIRTHCDSLRSSNPESCRLLASMHQPLTALQSSRRQATNLDRSRYLFYVLLTRHLIACLNPHAHKSRLYWLTVLGTRCQRRVRSEDQLPRLVHDFPQVDWELYGWLCHRHRSAVIREAHEPLQPAMIKRHARRRDESIRMSANNVRDVLKLLLQRGLVERLLLPGERYPRYRLTPVGEDMRHLLIGAEAPVDTREART